ncbi:hypothetical protein [Clostridium sp. D33t1_170424_F3]|uniref:hypothetical protein n=1 Tax=Clostridium sp. D33t1_170424_F3 TaxID=2787099 RepID=UPI0018A90E35|nr:hypothetical protein [Clostridium sp. D33t1_170424_F3]
MRWILSADPKIAVDTTQLQARRVFIQDVTCAEVSDWGHMQISVSDSYGFFQCISNDGVDGVFITAHMPDVHFLCNFPQIYNTEFIVANTCIWERLSHKSLLYSLRSKKQDAQLWFAKQELSVDANHLFRQSTTLNNVGQFGFQTSLSERKLFMHRKKGLVNGIQESFDRVSPIVFLGE